MPSPLWGRPSRFGSVLRQDWSAQYEPSDAAHAATWNASFGPSYVRHWFLKEVQYRPE